MSNQSIYRACFNQPSKLQLMHSLHGIRCIVNDTGGTTVRVYFTSGNVHSMDVPRHCIQRIKISERG